MLLCSKVAFIKLSLFSNGWNLHSYFRENFSSSDSWTHSRLTRPIIPDFSPGRRCRGLGTEEHYGPNSSAVLPNRHPTLHTTAISSSASEPQLHATAQACLPPSRSPLADCCSGTSSSGAMPCHQQRMQQTSSCSSHSLISKVKNYSDFSIVIGSHFCFIGRLSFLYVYIKYDLFILFFLFH